jgi:hypothetical protein
MGRAIAFDALLVSGSDKLGTGTILHNKIKLDIDI